MTIMCIMIYRPGLGTDDVATTVIHLSVRHLSNPTSITLNYFGLYSERITLYGSALQTAEQWRDSGVS
jgi:hypothetical protein